MQPIGKYIVISNIEEEVKTDTGLLLSARDADEFRYKKAKVVASGTDVTHTVIIQGEQSRCTCNWFTNHQGKRGLCKHILAVKMISN